MKTRSVHSGARGRGVTIWYDGTCPLCRREMALMQRLDRRGRLHFIDATVEGASCPIDHAELLSRFHACEDGVMLTGASSFTAMWRAIPLLQPIGLLARYRPILTLIERLYMRFLRYRPAIQRLFA